MKRLLSPFAVLLAFSALLAFRPTLLELATTPAAGWLRVALDRAIQIGFWLSAAGLLNRLPAIVLWDGIFRRAVNAPAPRLLRHLISLSVYASAVTIIVGQVFDLPLTAFWATSGVVGLVLGFALRNVTLGVFSGLALNVDSPFVIGDWIQIHTAAVKSDLIGRVVEINWRTTRLLTESNTTVIVPNSLYRHQRGGHFLEPGRDSTPPFGSTSPCPRSGRNAY